MPISKTAVLCFHITIAALMVGPSVAQDAPAGKQAEVERGKKLFDQCAACHSVDPKVNDMPGPNLHGVVGRKAGKQPGFAYSDALSAKNFRWTAEKLDQFLKDPSEFAPGTAMAFSGLKNDADRQAVINYLKTV